MYKRIPALLAILMFGLAMAETADAQILDRVRDRVVRDAERRVENRMVNAARRAMDATEDAIVCVATDPECIQAARDEDAELVIVDESGDVVSYENDPRAPAEPEVEAEEPEEEVVPPGDTSALRHDLPPAGAYLTMPQPLEKA
jgi:hypothetical protein